MPYEIYDWQKNLLEIDDDDAKIENYIQNGGEPNGLQWFTYGGPHFWKSLESHINQESVRVVNLVGVDPEEADYYATGSIEDTEVSGSESGSL